MIMKISSYKHILFLLILIAFTQCTKDNPEPTASFRINLTGDISKVFEGTATFKLEPLGDNGILTIRLDGGNSEFIRLTYLNPDPAQIFLEPGTYNVVPQLGNEIKKEVLVDFVTVSNTFIASSGQVTVGISKNSQITGNLNSVFFNIPNTTANGSYDAIPSE